MKSVRFLLVLAVGALPALAAAQRCPAPARPVAADQMAGYASFLRTAADTMQSNDEEGFVDSADQVSWRDGWLGYLCSDATSITTWTQQNDMLLQASPGCLDVYGLACSMNRETMVQDFRDAAALVEACSADLDQAVQLRTNECTAPEPTADLPSTDVFTDALAPYGTWERTREHGAVWYPSTEVVGANWRPFHRDGRWQFTDRGWTWVTDQPWGWGPYHYGRWGWNPARRAWFWVPGRTWMPAVVDFRYHDDAIGWAPLAPAGAPEWPVDMWTYVPPAQIYSPTWVKFVYVGPRVVHYHQRATVVRVAVGPRVVFGPPIRIVERHGVVVRPVPLRHVVRVAPPRVSVRVTVLPSGRHTTLTAGVRPGVVVRPLIRPVVRPGVTVKVPVRPKAPLVRPAVVRAPAPPPKAMRQPRPGGAVPRTPVVKPQPHARPTPAAKPTPAPRPRPAAKPAPAPARPAAKPAPAPKPAPAARPAPAPKPAAKPAPAPKPAAKPAPAPAKPKPAPAAPKPRPGKKG
jgi:hypothetical protein